MKNHSYILNSRDTLASKMFIQISLMKINKKSSENLEKNIRIELLQYDIQLKHWKSYELNE